MLNLTRFRRQLKAHLSDLVLWGAVTFLGAMHKFSYLLTYITYTSTVPSSVWSLH